MKEFLAGVPRKSKRTVDFLVDLNQYVHRAVKYLIRMEPGVQTCEETLTLGSGSCRDSAWLLVQTLRNLGLAARFVSGYLIQLTPDMKPLDGPPGPNADFTDLHAWTEVYLPGAAGWGSIPPPACLRARAICRLAATPSPDSAAPISRLHRRMRRGFFRADVGHPRRRRPARHQALYRRAMGGGRTAWP